MCVLWGGGYNCSPHSLGNIFPHVEVNIFKIMKMNVLSERTASDGRLCFFAHANYVAIILLINNQVQNISEGGEEGGLTL